MDEFELLREQMVSSQIERRGVTNDRVLQAMRTIPRHKFVPAGYKNMAYEDHPVPIGFGQTVSQPYIVALMTSLLCLEGNEKILEIGTGSGYQAAILSLLAAQVHSIEIVPELATSASSLLAMLDFGNVYIHLCDGTLGWKDEAPYDAILITAAAPAAPQPLFEQMSPRGRMVLPVGASGEQWLQVWENMNGVWQQKNILPVAFVPLLGQHGWHA